MYGKTWQTSDRAFTPQRQEDVDIVVSDGITINTGIVRPAEDGRFPAILCVHAYSKEDQYATIKPTAMSMKRGHIEAGDPMFFARRGYAHVVANIRGTGKSTGYFGNLDPRSIEDIAEVIEWLAAQPWCNGRVGMFGVSYFAIVQQRVAALEPPSLKAIFAPYGWTDAYRDRYYRGGMLSHAFMRSWMPTVDNPKLPPARDASSQRHRQERAKEVLKDEEIAQVPFLVNALKSPDEGFNQVLLDVLLNPLDGEYYRQRSVDPNASPKVPAYLGGCWGIYGLHLPGAFRSWNQWGGAKKLTIGPPIYLDRPVYQYHYEALRWFDHWLKDVDTGILTEKPVQVYIDGTGEWRGAEDWPLPETCWTPFYLHENGLLLEREHWPNEGTTTFEDSPYSHGRISFRTPPAVELTEICGPITLDLYASTTDEEVLWYVSLQHIDQAGNQRLLTRGWLRGSQRKLDESRSTPWQPVHAHESREPLVPGQTYLFNIEIRPYGIQLKPGEALKLTIACADDEAPPNVLHAIAGGGVSRRTASRVTVYHNEQQPSRLWLPITRGNRIGFFLSGGQLPAMGLE